MQSNYFDHWEEKFKARSWGRYPPEDLVRFIGRNYKYLENKHDFKILEVGCGPGANLWFLHREGFSVSGIDISETAIRQAGDRLADENAGLNPISPDLKPGNFSKLPWDDEYFDLVIDIFSICANPTDVIESTLTQINRVLKPRAKFYTKFWGRGCTGFGEGKQVDDGSDGTYDEIPSGPCKDMGVSHFFNEAEIKQIYSKYFDVIAIDKILRTDSVTGSNVDEFACQFQKKS